jgi:hypothetical protein
MATIVDILLGIETRLKTVPGLRVTEYAPGQINPPHAIVGVPPIDNYHQAMKGRDIDFAPTVTVLVSATLDRPGQLKLAGYASPTGDQSIPAAIEADRKLGGTVGDCRVVSYEPLGLEEVGAIGYYGGVFTLRVLA